MAKKKPTPNNKIQANTTWYNEGAMKKDILLTVETFIGAGDDYVDFRCDNLTDYDLIVITYDNLFYIFMVAQQYLDSYYLQSTSQRVGDNVHCWQLAKTSHDKNEYRIRKYKYVTNLETGDVGTELINITTPMVIGIKL